MKVLERSENQSICKHSHDRFYENPSQCSGVGWYVSIMADSLWSSRWQLIQHHYNVPLIILARNCKLPSLHFMEVKISLSLKNKSCIFRQRQDPVTQATAAATTQATYREPYSYTQTSTAASTYDKQSYYQQPQTQQHASTDATSYYQQSGKGKNHQSYHHGPWTSSCNHL